MLDRKKEILEEDIISLSEKVTPEKFLKRQKEFVIWLDSFIETAKARGTYPPNTRLIQGMNSQEMGLYLNYFYWRWNTDFVKKVLVNGGAGDRTNHYKIAATIEFVVMTFAPIEDENGNPLNELNANFAFHIALQILFNWNIEKENISPSVIRDLIVKNKPTKEFIAEHKTWLRHHAKASQFSILSNMQTMRLFHYWFRDPKDDGFSF